MPEDHGDSGSIRHAVDGAVGAIVGRVTGAALDVTAGSAREVVVELEPFLIDELIPRVVEGLTPLLVERTIPEVLDGATPELADRLIPQLLDRLTPYLETELVPRIVDGLTPHIVEVTAPRIVDGLTPHIVEVTAPRIVDGLTPHIVEVTAPQIVDALMPKIREEVVPSVLEDIVDDPRVAGLIREQSQGLLLDALEQVRRLLAKGDDVVENIVRHIFFQGRRPPVDYTPPPGRTISYAGALSRAVGLGIDLALAAFVIGVGLNATLNLLNKLFDPAPDWAVLIVTGFAVTVTPIYLGLAWWAVGSTFGDWVAGTRQARTDGSRLGFWQAMVKAWLGLFGLWLWAVGEIQSAFNAKRQGWLDLLTRTEVLYVARVIWHPDDDRRSD